MPTMRMRFAVGIVPAGSMPPQPPPSAFGLPPSRGDGRLLPLSADARSVCPLLAESGVRWRGRLALDQKGAKKERPPQRNGCPPPTKKPAPQNAGRAVG